MLLVVSRRPAFNHDELQGFFQQCHVHAPLLHPMHQEPIRYVQVAMRFEYE